MRPRSLDSASIAFLALPDDQLDDFLCAAFYVAPHVNVQAPESGERGVGVQRALSRIDDDRGGPVCVLASFWRRRPLYGPCRAPLMASAASRYDTRRATLSSPKADAVPLKVRADVGVFARGPTFLLPESAEISGRFGAS